MLLAALVFAAYTNHAGHVLSGVPVRVEPKYVTLSNAVETLRLPFSAFPEGEKRRLAADGGSVQFVPPEIRNAVEGNRKALRRLSNRLSQGLVGQEDHDASAARAHAALRRYLDKAEKDSRLLPAERRLLGEGRR